MRETLKDKVRFWFGLGILAYEVAWEQTDRPWIVLAGLGLMGYSGVSKLAKLLDSSTDSQSD